MLLSPLNVGDSFSGVDFEIYYRANTCWLYSLNGVVSFLDLYKQFHFLDEPSSLKVLSKRPITEGEHDIFMMSKWSSIWVLTFSVIFPFTLSGLLLEELSITIIFLIICSPLIYLIFKVAKKRENYIASRMVYRLKGNVSFDEEKEVYLIEDRELKLHRKWRKVLEEKNNWGEVETEAIMHTYDNWNTVAKQSFQPITFKAVGLTLNESSIKSTRGWRVLALYFTCLMPLLFITPIIDMAEDVFYGYRTSKLPSDFNSIDALFKSPLKHRQEISTIGLAIQPYVR